MSLAGLLAAVAEDPQLRTALDSQPGTPDARERDLVAPQALRPLISAALATGAAGGPGRFVLAVTATAREADDLTAALRAFLPPHAVATFPGWETLPHERLSPRSDTVGQRIAVLRRLQHPEVPRGSGQVIPGDEGGPTTAGGNGGGTPATPNGHPRRPADQQRQPTATYSAPQAPSRGLAPGEGAMGEGLPHAWGGHPPGGGIAGPLNVVVAPIRAVLQPIVSGLGDLVPVRLAAGDEADPEDVISRLIEIGYARVEMVARRGELAVRGGLLDVFPPTEEHPLRVEFFGDTVEEIRVFKVADQRSAGQAEHGLWAPPCRELLLTPSVRARAKELAAKHPAVSDILGRIADGITVEGMEAFSSVLADRMDLLLDHLPLGAVVLACDPERIRTRAIELVATSQEFLEASWASAASGGEAPVDLGGSAFQPIETIREAATELGVAWWTLAPFGVTDDALDTSGSAGPATTGNVRGAAGPAPGTARRGGYGGGTPAALDGRPRSPADQQPQPAGTYSAPQAPSRALPGEGDMGEGLPHARGGHRGGRPPGGDTAEGSQQHPFGIIINASPAAAYRGETNRMMADVREWLADGWRVVLVTEGHGPAKRLAEVLHNEGFGARVGDLDAVPEPSVPYVATGELRQGFSWPAIRLAVLTEADFAARGTSRPSSRDERRMPSARRRGGVDPLQLKPGDYVVHEQHGVGRFVEMTSRTAAGATRDYLVLEYAPAKRGHPPDRLYVPTDQLDEVTRYVGGETPTLHRLGGADWAKTKGRARKAVREIAAELIRLYSARMASPGHAFGPDTPWQRELEDAFPYVETPDQLSAIDEVKRDMEKPVPMDRLICGDVGYGKTEIAVRAAFKAVQDGKQVAVLVPTTILAQQHFNTFSERYAPFPVVVKPMSRFQTVAEVAETQRGLFEGTVDVVIGTHRLLSPETRFKKLGLVIIDEEQRFGVEHKEYLKRLRTEVDVLAMSATPIPRTLEMGVAGIREMSTILTPPEERHPVLTFVGPYDEKQIAAAIRRELLRDGQIFFVHNRVQSIKKVAARLGELVPEARIQVAHGQMNEHELERIMIGFWDRSFDILVATTIVESGLDIPNANTLVVDRADAQGLSQLHQLRGRVGRGRERAYAYFLYPPDKPLTETAHERLATVAQHTEIGAGMYVALKDLEIRGAGNLLGGEQSGHIAGVGFDLYVRMIGEAVRELKDDAPAERPEVRVELPVNAHIPHDYIPGERLRLAAYTSIASIDSEDDVAAVRDELRDRYGELPLPVVTLLDVARLRFAARRAGLTDITLQGSHVRFAPVVLPDSRTVRVQRLYPKTLLKPAVRTMLVPVPKSGASSGGFGGEPLRDTELLAWCADVIRSVLSES